MESEAFFPMIKVTVNEELCKGCGLCVRACPKKIVSLSHTKINSKGYHPAGVENMDECIACAACARNCPDTVIEIEKS